MTSIENKVVLVTGSGSGIGRAAAVAFGQQGYKVIVSGRRIEAGEETVHQITQAGGDAIYVKADVTIERDVEALVKATVNHYGRLDYAFNNAGVEGTGTPLTDVLEADWDRIIDTNLKSVWLSLKYEIPQMRERGGAIVNNASVLGQIGVANTAIYGASKAGVIGLTRTAAIEYAKANIRVNGIAPALVETDMVERAYGNFERVNQAMGAYYPLGRIGRPVEVANTVLWLCSDASSFVTGQILSIDGGVTAQ